MCTDRYKSYKHFSLEKNNGNESFKREEEEGEEMGSTQKAADRWLGLMTN